MMKIKISKRAKILLINASLFFVFLGLGVNSLIVAITLIVFLSLGGYFSYLDRHEKIKKGVKK